MVYQRGNSANIIVGAAAIFFADPRDVQDEGGIPAPTDDLSYKETLSTNANRLPLDDTDTQAQGVWRNVGYTSNGLELQFAPEFGEVQVDQILDVVKMFKSGMTVTLNTSFAEATLENLAFAIAENPPVKAPDPLYLYDKDSTSTTPTKRWGTSDTSLLTLNAGELGDCPVEKTLIAVGTGGGIECDPSVGAERIYTAFRVLSIESVTASQKRDEASVYDVSFRLLPDNNGRYGQIVDRTFVPGTLPTVS